MEIRVWQHSGWWELEVFILKRLNGKWTADLQKQTFREGTEILRKISKKKLKEPKSEWEPFWKKLIDEEILTLPDGSENGGSEPCPDCNFVIIEANVDNNYRFYIYTAPSLKSEIRETRQVAKIGNTIAEEFNLQNFKSYEPSSSE